METRHNNFKKHFNSYLPPSILNSSTNIGNPFFFLIVERISTLGGQNVREVKFCIAPAAPSSVAGFELDCNNAR